MPVTPCSGFPNADRIRQREVDLGERLERRRERAVLKEVALSGQRVVEQAPRRTDARVPSPFGSHVAESRRDVVLVGLVRAVRHARVARIDRPVGAAGNAVDCCPGWNAFRCSFRLANGWFTS